jgi:23S rRNA (adenine2503-C2)-methyltransferase
MSEILGQVLALKRRWAADLTNFVFMGMGEPLDNFEAVERAIRVMNSPDGLGVGARRITVSTAGHAPGIERLAALDLQVNLSLSLHAANDRLRDELMPINRKWSLERVMQACETYLASGGRMMTLEYVLIEDVNDTLDDADGLAGVARRLRAKVNLIPYSPVPELAFRTPGEERIEIFRRRLEERRVHVTVRRSKGGDILAACGQLAGKTRDTGECAC